MKNDNYSEGFLPAFLTKSVNRPVIDLTKVESEENGDNYPESAPEHSAYTNDKNRFGSLTWFVGEDEDGYFTSLVKTIDGQEFTLTHKIAEDQHTRGLITMAGKNGQPDMTMIFNFEHSASNRKNIIQIMKIGPISAESSNYNLTRFHIANAVRPLQPHIDPKTPGEFIVSAIGVLSGRPDLWRQNNNI